MKLVWTTAIITAVAGLFVVLFVPGIEVHYKRLGIALPGLTEDLIDLSRCHGGYALVACAAIWVAKERWMKDGRLRTWLNRCAFAVALILPFLIAWSVILPLIAPYDGPLGAQAGG